MAIHQFQFYYTPRIFNNIRVNQCQSRWPKMADVSPSTFRLKRTIFLEKFVSGRRIASALYVIHLVWDDKSVESKTNTY
jgi:hypothetical protein